MELINPGLGLIIWMTIAFALVLWVLAKFAWKPIMKALKDREDSIDKALHAADQAREDMKHLESKHGELLAQAKDERDGILKDARDIRKKIIEESKLIAQEEGNRIVEIAKESIHYEKMAAITELKNQIAHLSIEIAEKLLKKELATDDIQNDLIKKLVDDIKIN